MSEVVGSGGENYTEDEERGRQAAALGGAVLAVGTASVLASQDAFGADISAIVEGGEGLGSYDWVQVDLATDSYSTLLSSSANNASADCEFVEAADTVVCSHLPASGSIGVKEWADPTGSPSDSTETGFGASVWKINVNDDNVTFAGSDYATYSYIWSCDDPTAINTSDCDQFTLSGTGAVAGATDTSDGYSLGLTNSDGLVHVIRTSDGTTMASEYTAPSLVDPAVSYPYDIALDTTNNVGYVLSDDTLTTVEVDITDFSTPTITEIAETLDSPYDILLFENPNTGTNEAWIACADDVIYVFDADGASSSLITTIAAPDDLSMYSPLARSEDGSVVYVVIANDDAIVSYETSGYTLADSWTTSNFPGPIAVAWETDVDDDGDGYTVADGDCADDDAAINPGATETCDEVDNNCDEQVDEGVTTDYWEDADGDGYGTGDAQALCAPDGTVDATVDGDCNDSDINVNPSAAEYCDATDWDCDGLAQDGAIDTTTWYRNEDGDGYGVDGDSIDACDPQGEYDVEEAGDCDDTEADTYPGAPEPECVDNPGDAIDYNCDDGVPFYPCESDEDGDGYQGDAYGGDDCNDLNPDINPGAPEYCDDGVDSNCDESDNAGAVDAPDWCFDGDNDGYGDATNSLTQCADPGEDYSTDCTDFDDTCVDCFPGAVEEGGYADNYDNDGDGVVDECTFDGGDWTGEEEACGDIDLGDGDVLAEAEAEDGLDYYSPVEGVKVLDLLGDGEVDMVIDKNSPDEIELQVDAHGAGAAVHGTTPEIHREDGGPLTFSSQEGCYDNWFQHEGAEHYVEDATCPGQDVVINPGGEIDLEASSSQAVQEYLKAIEEVPDPTDPGGCECSAIGTKEGMPGAGAILYGMMAAVLVLRRTDVIRSLMRGSLITERK